MSRPNKICAHAKRAEIDALLLNHVSYRAIAGQIEGISRQSVARYAQSERPCNSDSLPPKEAIRQEVARENKDRGLSGIRLLSDVVARLEDLTKVTPIEAPISSIYVAALRLQFDIAKLLGIEDNTKNRGGGIKELVALMRKEREEGRDASKAGGRSAAFLQSA